MPTQFIRVTCAEGSRGRGRAERGGPVPGVRSPDTEKDGSAKTRSETETPPIFRNRNPTVLVPVLLRDPQSGPRKRRGNDRAGI
ncbi:hypothetical protein GWI33_019201 [Rhynchophorus ferrugineus]|uniref:Uncharacterized protein n=1 Tax=Rhynchophorus ferrugineus TaxID=354439 RepID=A0A834HU86_RHYFE|nr:hypothetical protein GWI33_019201 [Rhynchophorus ferrugineus]